MSDEGRPVIKCQSCSLVQFVPESRRCRRCRSFLPILDVPKVIKAATVHEAPDQRHPTSRKNGRDNDLRRIIGDRLNAIRVGKGMSQGDLVKRTGLARTYISRIENGSVLPNIETLLTLRAALDFSIDNLVTIQK